MSAQYIHVQYNGYNICKFKYSPINIKYLSSRCKSTKSHSYEIAKHNDNNLLLYIEHNDREMVLTSIKHGSGDLFVMLDVIHAVKDNKILEYILSSVKCVIHNSNIMTVDLNYLGPTLCNSYLSGKCKFDFLCSCQLIHHINFN